MEGKINTHLFIMGLVTAILVSLITWLVFFNAFQNQVNTDLKTDAQLIATSYDYISDNNKLKDFAKGQIKTPEEFVKTLQTAVENYYAQQ